MPVDDAFTVALLHLNGTDASTVFTDESGKSWTANGNAQIDTAQSKFGGASGLFDGTTDWVHTADHADFDFGSGNFTIDFWVRFSSLAAVRALVAQRASSAAYGPFSISADSTNVYCLSSATGSSWGVSIIWAHGGAITTNTWYHFAFVRNGTDWRFYLDGVSKANVTVSQTVMASTVNVTIGALADGSTSHAGWLDEVRISKGIARWTANFTPPTQEYGNALIAAFGSFANNGQVATFRLNVPSAYGNFSVNGQSTVLGFILVANTGIFQLNGIDVALLGPPIPYILHAVSSDWTLNALGMSLTLHALPDDWTLNAKNFDT